MNIVGDLARKLQSPDNEDAAPDALALIHDDHQEVEALFATALSDTAASATKKVAIQKICDALTVHAKMEETIFYPALRKAGKKRKRTACLRLLRSTVALKT